MKSRMVVVLLVVAMMMFGARAQVLAAASPKLSGSYSFLSTTICQYVQTSGTSVAPSGSNNIESTVGIAHFTAAAGQVTLSATKATGSLISSTGAGDVTSGTDSGSKPFSVTSSTLTVGDKTYNAVYWGIANGVANRVRMMRTEGSLCIESATLDRN